MDRATLTDRRGAVWTVEIPVTRRERMLGLLGRDALEPGQGLLLERTRSVHTFWMRFPITAVLLDRDFRVVAVRRMRPGRILLPRSRVRHVLECTDGADLQAGDVLRGEGPAAEPRRPAPGSGTSRRATRRT